MPGSKSPSSRFKGAWARNCRGIVFLFNIARVIIDSGHETEKHPVVSFSSPLSTLKSQMPEAVA